MRLTAVDKSVGMVGFGGTVEFLRRAPGTFEAIGTTKDDVGGAEAVAVHFHETAAARIALHAELAAGIANDDLPARRIGLPAFGGATPPRRRSQLPGSGIGNRPAKQVSVVRDVIENEGIDECLLTNDGHADEHLSV